jgi:hypothetical protein
MSKMSLKAVQPTVEEFIKSATSPTKSEYPWEDPRVRDDVMKMVSMRLSEPYAIKLQWISEQTGKAQQKMLRQLVEAWIDEQISQLT